MEKDWVHSMVIMELSGALISTVSSPSFVATPILFLAQPNNYNFSFCVIIILNSLVSVDSSLVLTGAADDTAKLWDTEKGVAIQTWNTNSAIRSCGFSRLGNLLMFSTEDRKDVDCEIFVYDTRSNEGAVSRIPVEGDRVSAGLWGPFDEYIITGHADGKVRHYDYKVRPHPLYPLSLCRLVSV